MSLAWTKWLRGVVCSRKTNGPNARDVSREQNDSGLSRERTQESQASAGHGDTHCLDSAKGRGRDTMHPRKYSSGSNNSPKNSRKTAAVYRMEKSSNKSKSLSNSISPRPSTCMSMNGRVFEEVDQFTYLGSTKTADGTSVMDAKIILAHAHSAVTRLAERLPWKNKAISFPTNFKLYKSLVWELDDDCESWEANPSFWKQMLQDDAWLIIAKHKRKNKWTYIYRNGSMFSLDVMSSYNHSSNIASYRGSTISAVMICCCRTSYNGERSSW